MKEFNSLNQEYTDKVISKNDKIISQRFMRHMWGSDNRHLVIITEYKSMEEMVAAQELNNKLFEKAWTTKEDRDKFNKAYNKYFGHHSDEIYSEVKSGRK